MRADSDPARRAAAAEDHGREWLGRALGLTEDQDPFPWQLKLAEKTVKAMAQAGEIPAFKLWGQWRIRRAELEQWIDARPRGSDGGRDGG